MTWEKILKYQRFPQLNQLITELEMTDLTMSQEQMDDNKTLAEAMKHFLEREEIRFGKIKEYNQQQG